MKYFKIILAAVTFSLFSAALHAQISINGLIMNVFYTEEEIKEKAREMKALLVNSVKPIDLDSDSEFFEEYFEMVAACYGGDKERAKREPINTVGCCPASPLQLDAELCATALTGPKYGFPVNILSMAMAAASSPIYLAGTLVTHNAEVLSGIVLVQLAFPGHPVIYGSSTPCFDFYSESAPVGSPEIAMIGAGVATLAQYYGIPSIVAGS